MLRLRADPHALLKAIPAGINSFTVDFADNYGGRGTRHTDENMLLKTTTYE